MRVFIIEIVVIVADNSTTCRITRFRSYVREFRKRIERRDYLNANRKSIVIMFI
jgi:hypothetical protein